MSGQDKFQTQTEIIDRFFASLRESTLTLYAEAEGAGYRRGYAQAFHEIWEKVQTVLPRGSVPLDIAPKRLEADAPRVERGAVKPKIRETLAAHPEGLSASDLAAVADLKENTVRSKLNELRQAGEVVKQGERWLLAKNEGVFE